MQTLDAYGKARFSGRDDLRTDHDQPAVDRAAGGFTLDDAHGWPFLCGFEKGVDSWADDGHLCDPGGDSPVGEVDTQGVTVTQKVPHPIGCLETPAPQNHRDMRHLIHKRRG